jgi:NAD+ synthase (glutamine-hydrolysing)
MNTAVVIGDGRVLGIVPKQYLPTYREFYEGRHFRAGDGSEAPLLDWLGQRDIPFGIDLLFRWHDAIIGIEICEDLWCPVPPSSLMALAGANVLLNLSASNETIGKAAWRRELVLSQSGRCIAAYAYASAGPTESTTDLVFGGHCLIAENGVLLGQSRHVGDGEPPDVLGTTSVTAEIDLQKLMHDRRLTSSFDDGRLLNVRKYRQVEVLERPLAKSEAKPLQAINGRPFVPQAPGTLDRRCAEILALQSAGLAKRLSQLSEHSPLVIGVSGGLDSTLALLVAVRTCDAGRWPRSRILGLTLPGFGTTATTHDNAQELMRLLGIRCSRIDIRQLALDTFRAMGHGVSDLVFENVQARLRTFLLMSHGFVLGTGDMSEQALGWSTYNGDHMSMYNVNTSIPKTLVKFLVRHVALHDSPADVREVLLRIADTPISPELLPPDAEGRIRQSTEAVLGAYELHDFFLYHFIRYGFTREKIRYLAQHAEFEGTYTSADQDKRSCVPDGPKVGSVSLSPRGDWRMPSDGNSGAF